MELLSNTYNTKGMGHRPCLSNRTSTWLCPWCW